MSGSCSCDKVSGWKCTSPEQEPYWIVWNEMVDVMATLPPPNGETATEVSDKHANECIDYEIMSDASVSCIVGCKHDLMLLQLVSFV